MRSSLRPLGILGCALMFALGPISARAQSSGSQENSAPSQSGSGADAGQTPDDQKPDAQKPEEPQPEEQNADSKAAGSESSEQHADAPKPQEPPSAVPQDSMAPMPAGVGSVEPPKTEENPGDETKQAGQEGHAGEKPGAPESGASPSEAMPSGRPFSGLFGGAAPLASRKDRLDVSGSLYAVRAFYPAVPEVDPGTGLAPPESTYGGGFAALTYAHAWTHGSIGADGSISEAYIPEYKDVGQEWVTRWNVGGGGDYSRSLGRRVSFSAGGHVNYSPYIQQNLFMNGPPTVELPPVGAPYLDYVLGRAPSVGTNGDTRLNFAINPRSSIEAFYVVNYRAFVEGDHPSQYDQYGGARYHYRFNNYVGLRAGYAYRYARYGFDDAQAQVSHLIDVGLEGGYGHSYALTRRTTFSFNTGSSIFAADEVRQDLPPGEQNVTRARFNLDASADLLHSWARTWSFRTGYRRGSGYETGFSQPLFYDSAFATLGGLIAPRIDYTANAFYTNGTVGFTGRNNGYRSGSLSTSLRGAISRNIAAYVQYFYYRNFYESGVTLPFYLLRNVERQGVVVGLTAWAPLISPRGRP